MVISDYIALAIIAAVSIAIVVFIVRQKKKGVKCIGCPYGKCNTCCGDNCNLKENS